MQEEITERLTRIHSGIKLAESLRRVPVAAPVTLIAVSKQQPHDRIEAALAAGQRVFGENRVQEAKGRWPALRGRYPDVRLHLIGPLQTNKVKEALGLFDVIQTVDREKLAKALAKLLAESPVDGKTAPDSGYRTLDSCMIQINVGEESQKSGIAPKEANAFIEHCLHDLKLPVTGLMCIPPVDEPPFPFFALLREMAARHSLPHLSMGMSGDFEEAIRFGATHVRVGTGLFGPRP